MYLRGIIITENHNLERRSENQNLDLLVKETNFKSKVSLFNNTFIL